MAGNFAALLELSYRLSRQGTTVWEMNLEAQRMHWQQQVAILYHLGIQAGLSSAQAYNAASSAIRMDGATVAMPGYESVPSDYLPFNLGSSGLSSFTRGQGYSSFNAFKAAQGNAGPDMEWHHIVEQSQIQKSGFMPEDIHSTGNIISIDAATHRKMSAYYSSKRPFTQELTVRNWLVGQDFETQYNFGLQVLKMFLK